MKIYHYFIICLIMLGFAACSQSEDEGYVGENTETKSICGIEDGIHAASVDYYNPNTHYSNTYSLEVEVEDCEVIKIEFPNGGWLDQDHIEPTELSSDGTAKIEDDRGRQWEVTIE